MNDLFQLEVEDARALVRDMRGNPDSFYFDRQERLMIQEGCPTRCYTVMVECLVKKRHYQGGYGLDWVHHFEFDLCCGIFEPESNGRD